jgi:invasion protein IalB
VSGYPFAPGSKVEAKIGSSLFKMFTSGENGWLDSPDVDAKMVTAMKNGATAVVTGVSSRGTKTTDTFSLRGFTYAVKKAQELCK